MMDARKSLIFSNKIIQYPWQTYLILILYLQLNEDWIFSCIKYKDNLVDICTLCMYYTVNHSSKYVTTFLMY